MLTSVVLAPRVPQSMSMWTASASGTKKVRRKQSPSPWRYIRTRTRGVDLGDGPPPARVPRVAGLFAVEAGRRPAFLRADRRLRIAIWPPMQGAPCLTWSHPAVNQREWLSRASEALAEVR